MFATESFDPDQGCTRARVEMSTTIGVDLWQTLDENCRAKVIWDLLILEQAYPKWFKAVWDRCPRDLRNIFDLALEAKKIIQAVAHA